MKQLNGIFPAIVTPFKQDGELDLASFKENLTALSRTGITGYLLFGSTGEFVHLSELEKVTILEEARATIPEEMPMIVGTGLHSTSATIAFTKRAAELGASYALVVTPHYFKSAMTPSALKAYYLAVADSSPVPVILYSVPIFTGVQLAPETIAALSEHPNIVGIKDSSGDLKVLINTLSLVKPEFNLLTGSAQTLYPAFACGASGAVLAVANFASKVCVEIYQLSKEGQREKLRDYQQRLLHIAEQVATKYGVGGIKYAMNLLGLKRRASSRAKASAKPTPT